MGRQVSSRHKPLQTKGAWDRLISTAQNLKLLGSLGDAEARRVKEAVEILNTVPNSPKRKKYKQFLCDVLSKPGHQAVLVCAVALGQVKVVDMKNHDRIGLLRRIQKSHTDFDHPTLGTLAVSHRIPNSINDLQPMQTQEPNPVAGQPVQQIGSFAGRVFELTIEDARAITMSDQVKGGVWLTDPYSGESLPFITISISQNMSHEFAIRRPQAM